MTTREPLFSVVTISFRNRDGLARTGASLREQEYAGYEWIVIDGGSADGTVEYLEGVADDRLTFVSEPDRGIYDGMGKGLERARGRYTVFMNAGDLFAGPTVLADVAAAVASASPDLVYGDAYESDGVTSHYKPARSVAANRLVMFTHHQAQYYRTEAIRAIGFDMSYRLSADWVLTTRLLAKPETVTLYIPRPLCIFERGGVSQQSGGARRTMEAELYRLYREEHHRSIWTAVSLWLLRVGGNRLRRRLPWLHQRVRYASTAKVGGASSSGRQ